VNKVSVILPFHKIQPFLRPAIESILRSNHDNFELLLISDGLNKQDLRQVEKWISDSRIKLLENSGRGLVDALNSGIRYSSSEYLARMDSDDLADSDRLRAQSAFLDANPKVDVVGSNIDLVCSHGLVVGRSTYPRRLGRSFATKSFSARVAHPAVMMRRESVLRVGMYRHLYPGFQAEDLDLWNRILRNGKINNLRQHLLQYRVHADQVSTRLQVVMAESTKLAALVDIYESFGLPQSRAMPTAINARELESLLLSEPYRQGLSLRGRARLAFFMSSSNSMAAIGQLAARLRLSSRRPSAKVESASVIAKWIFGNPVMFIISGLLQVRALFSKLLSRTLYKPCPECAKSF
jgi:glycosyltransferase involved in cell wall biosynthesis